MPRGQSYDDNEYQSLLDLYAELRPLSASEWRHLADQHTLNFPEKGRDGPSLSRKFHLLRKAKPPTGGTRPPWYVERARELYNELKGSCGGSTGSIDNDDELNEDDVEENDAEEEGGGEEGQNGGGNLDNNGGDIDEFMEGESSVLPARLLTRKSPAAVESAVERARRLGKSATSLDYAHDWYHKTGDYQRNFSGNNFPLRSSSLSLSTASTQKSVKNRK